MRVKIDWRSSSKDEYLKFCKKNPHINLTFDEWKNILFLFNDYIRTYILETGSLVKLPFGFGLFGINKRKRKMTYINKEGKEKINLPIDWKKTKEKGKIVYIFNYHTDGYSFNWIWFPRRSFLPLSSFWYLRPTRATSRTLKDYLTFKNGKKYSEIYKTWKK